MGYRAFFSYSRADDRIANWLHRQLDAYRTPKALVGTEGPLGPAPSKLHPIFRDRTDLQSGGHVDEALQQALEESQTLIVLCTPHSAKSQWVNHECETFLRMGREDHIFPVIAAGDPESGAPDTECFPPALRGKGLLAADLREIKLPNGRLIGDGKGAGRLKLIAGLLGVPLDALAQRERRRQRRLMAVLGVASLLFATLAVAAAIMAGLASSRLDRSLRAESLEQVERAAERLEAGDPLSAMSFALGALPQDDERPLLADATAALQAAKAEDRLLLVRRRDGAIAQSIAFSPDDRELFVLWNDGVLERIDRATGLVRALARFAAPECELQPLVLGLDRLGQTVFGLCPDVTERWPGGAVLIWDVANPTTPRLAMAPPFEIARQLPSTDRYPVSFAGTRALLHVMPSAPPVLTDFGAAPFVRGVGAADSVRAELLQGGALVATLSVDENEHGVACIWDAVSGARQSCTPSSLNVIDFALDPAGERLALIEREGVEWWDYRRNTRAAALFGDQSDLVEHGVAIARGALFGVTHNDRAVIVSRPLNGTGATALTLRTSAETLDALRLSHGGRFVAGAANSAAIAVWELAPAASRDVEAPERRDEIVSARIDDGNVAAAWKTDQGVQVAPAGAPLAYAEIVDDRAIVVTAPSGARRIELSFDARFVEAVRAAVAARGEARHDAERVYPPRINHVEVSRDGMRALFVAERSGVCEVWDVASARLLYSSLSEAAAAWRAASASQGALYWSCVMSANGARVARAGNVGVDLRNVDSGRSLWSDSRSFRLRFSGDGARLGAFSDRSGVLLVDAHTGTILIANPNLNGLQMRALAGPESDQAVEIANDRLRLVRLSDGVELARMNGDYFPGEYGPWQSVDGRWLLTRSLHAPQLFDLSASSIETQIAAARARAFPSTAYGPSNLQRADRSLIPRQQGTTRLRCDAILRDPLDPSLTGDAPIFPGADYAREAVGHDTGCARASVPPRVGDGALYAWALSYLQVPSDRGPGDGDLFDLGASIVNPPLDQPGDFEASIVAALEQAGRGGRPIALLRAAQLRVSDARSTPDWDGAIALARTAARRRTPAAAWWLSEALSERGQLDEARCWRAYAAGFGFPHAYARLAETWERDAARHSANAEYAKASVVKAIEYWTRTIESARASHWSVGYGDYARTRRAILARSQYVDTDSVAAAWRRGVDREQSRQRFAIFHNWIGTCPVT